jgi:CO dehydrogenase maturation factor
MTLSIAVAGKGGTGKTTLCALLVGALCRTGVRPILAVDADPNANLAEMLSVEPGETLAEIREFGASPEGSPPSGIGRVRLIQDHFQRAISEADGFDLLTMGRPEGPRCYCAVNSLLRRALDELAKNYAAVVVDNEAGMEHLSRRTTNEVDFLVTVLNPTMPSLRAAQRILALSRELPVRIGCRAVLVNRVGAEGVGTEIEEGLARLGASRLPDVPEDRELERIGAVGGNVWMIREGTPALAAAVRLAQALCGGHAAAGDFPSTGFHALQGRGEPMGWHAL